MAAGLVAAIEDGTRSSCTNDTKLLSGDGGKSLAAEDTGLSRVTASSASVVVGELGAGAPTDDALADGCGATAANAAFVAADAGEYGSESAATVLSSSAANAGAGANVASGLPMLEGVVGRSSLLEISKLPRPTTMSSSQRSAPPAARGAPLSR